MLLPPAGARCHGDGAARRLLVRITLPTVVQQGRSSVASPAQHGLQQPVDCCCGECPNMAANPGECRKLARQHENRHDLRGVVRSVAAHRSALLSIEDWQELYLNSLKGA